MEKFTAKAGGTDTGLQLRLEPRELVNIGQICGCPLWIELSGSPEKKERHFLLARKMLYRAFNQLAVETGERNGHHQ